jgi:hypothetical protein
LPPVQKGCQFYPLDTAVDAEPQEQAVEMRLHSSASHVELPGNLGVVTALQQKFSNLFLAWTQPDRRLVHPKSSPGYSPLPADQAILTRHPGTPDLNCRCRSSLGASFSGNS